MNVSQKHAVNGNLAVPPFPQNMEQIMIGKLIDRISNCPFLHSLNGYALFTRFNWNTTDKLNAMF